jgi:hypothetical protein
MKYMLENAYFIASIIIAFIAVLGFVVSMCTSAKTSKVLNETSETLKLLNRNLGSMVEPYIDISRFEFIPSTGPLSCQHPPGGIHIRFRNTSNIPIIVTDAELRTSIGGVVIEKSSNSVNDTSDEIILPSGAETGMTIKNPTFRELLKDKKDILLPPYVRIDFVATISTFDGFKIYKVNLVDDIGVSCESNYSMLNIMKIKSTITPIGK